MGSKDEKKTVIEAADLTLANIESALADDTKVKLAGLDIDGKLGYLLDNFCTDCGRNSTWQAHFKKEISICSKRWIRFLQCCVWLGYA